METNDVTKSGITINGRMKVKTLKSDFFKAFGLNIRIYDGRSFADDDATLASIRKGDNKGSEFSPRRNTKIGNLEDKMMELFGLKVQIAGSDDSYLCNDDLTIAGAYEIDQKKMGKDIFIQKNTIKEEVIANSHEGMGVQVINNAKLDNTLIKDNITGSIDDLNSSDAIIIKEMSFNGELTNISFNKILFWEEADALEDINSFEGSKDIYAMIFNSPAFCGCDNLEELYDREIELWEGLQEYSDQYDIYSHKLWDLIVKSYCSLLVKSYSYKDIGEFKIKDIHITGKEEILAKLLKENYLTYDDFPEQLGLTISESFGESHTPSEINVETYNFDEGPEKISLTHNSQLFPNRSPTEEMLISDYHANDICLFFTPTGTGSAHIEEIFQVSCEDSDYIYDFEESVNEIVVEDFCSYIKNKTEKIDFTRLLKEKNNTFYEWVLGCHDQPRIDENSVKISHLKKLVIKVGDKTYYFTSDSSVVKYAERKTIQEMISLVTK